MSSIDTSNRHIAQAIAQYTPRAQGYEAADDGWHVDLANDFPKWLPPPPDAAVLDLACGTGLVTLAYARKIGPKGLIVGIDLTEAMLDEARKKSFPAEGPRVQLIRADIMDLSGIKEVSDVVRERGGFDIISVCSALVLLSDPSEAIKNWVPLLKKGSGRLIIDVPTEDKSLAYLFGVPIRKAIGREHAHDLDWVRGIHSLEKLYVDAGLEVEKSLRTRSYVPERTYKRSELWEAWEHRTSNGVKKLAAEDGLSEKIRDIWPGIWEKSLNENGEFWNGHALYVSIGKRAEI